MNKLFANIDACKDFINKLKRLNNPNKKEFLSDEKINLSVSMTLFTILNTIIEIGEEIIDLENYRTPQNYREIFEILLNEKVISYEIASEMKNHMKDRNMIAHQYAFFDMVKIYELAQKHELFENFIDEILVWLKGKK